MDDLTAAWLAPAELVAPAGWFAGLVARYGPPPAGGTWGMAVDRSLRAGAMAAMGVWRARTLVGALLVDSQPEVRTVLAGLGPLDDVALRAGVAALQRVSLALMWDERTGAHWLSATAPLGLQPYVRQVYTQAMALATYRDLDDGEVAIRPWQAADRAEAIALLRASNVGALDGLFLTAPRIPSLAACDAVLARALAGELGALIGDASLVARRDGQLVGVLLCLAGERPGEATLFEVAVHPAARGLQLSRRLIQGMQRALLAAGYREATFLTTGDNAPVHRLFGPETIVRYEETRGAYWIAPGAGA